MTGLCVMSFNMSGMARALWVSRVRSLFRQVSFVRILEFHQHRLMIPWHGNEETKSGRSQMVETSYLVNLMSDHHLHLALDRRAYHSFAVSHGLSHLAKL